MSHPDVAWDPRFDRDRAPFAPLAAAVARLRGFADWPSPDELTTALGDLAGVRFELQAPRQRRARQAPRALGELYEGRVFAAGAVPTRARNWHDLLNALVWATFPMAKRALNARHHACLRERVGETFRALPGARTPEQDALSMLDEGGVALVCAPDALDAAREALADGAHAVVHGLVARGALRALVFGHAVLEHLVTGDAGGMDVAALPALLAAETTLPEDPRALAALADDRLAAALADRGFLGARPAWPALPVTAALFVAGAT